MAEIDAGEHWQADRENLFRDDTDAGPLKKAYRRVRDSVVAGLLTEIRDGLEITAAETYHFSVATLSTPGSVQTLHTVTVPALTIREISQVVIVSRQESAAWIYVDGDLIGSVKTSASTPMATFSWVPRYPAAAGLEIKIDFRSRTGAPISDVDCHIQAIDKPT